MSRLQAVAQAAAPAVPVPVVWSPLGYPFEAGSMIAALSACLAVRLYVAMQSGRHWWRVDVPVTGLVLLLTMAVVIKFRPEPFYAIAWGCGLGALGAGVIAICMRWVTAQLDVLVPGTPPDPAHAESIARLFNGMPQPPTSDMQAQLDRLDGPKA